MALNEWAVVQDDKNATTSDPSAATDGDDISEASELWIRVTPGAGVTSWATLAWLYGGDGPTWEPVADSVMSGAANGDVIRLSPGPHSRLDVQITAIAGGAIDVELFASRVAR